ncbi:hypothetical protein GN244_ATG12281 [Phytophthora infestans]|uniref:Secreted protein n=1 Tax=Phytophthora infestans TaxID=4787 RepID=A0A833WB56_PHYIN|nr:hypothetical protein GN244_ATG12281 [Phytophthora infestans]
MQPRPHTPVLLDFPGSLAMVLLAASVRKYMVTCEVCPRHRAGQHRQGLLRPMLFPVCGLGSHYGQPHTIPNVCDTIQVMVCKLTKHLCHIPTTKAADAATVAELMFRQ